MKIVTILNAGEIWSNWNSHTLLIEMQNDSHFWKQFGSFV